MLIIFGANTCGYACDVCGCSASNQYLGILPQFYNHFIGFQYQYRSFNSIHPSPSINQPDEHSQEYYNAMQLWGRYYLGNRYQFFGFVPYHTNIQKADGGQINNSGIGDISFLANAVIIKADSSHGSWKHSWLAGGGIKLPTGKYTGITSLDREGLPNMQAGTGSFDFIVNSNYTVRYKMGGINLDAAYTLTTANSENYKYGNRLNAGLLAFYWLQKKSVSILPQVGFRYEYTLHDYDNYDKKWLNDQTGGYQSFATIGAQVYRKKMGIHFTYNIPVSQFYAAGYVTVKQRLEAGVLLLF